VFLVLARHTGIDNRVIQAGWVGVDLFFVLSGFLISGLLFDEYKRLGSIAFKRFMIRRMFKLYPAFYTMLIVNYFAESALGHVSSPAQYLTEATYLQNYLSPIWGHTWSLVVEEHFYILLPLFLLALIRLSSNGEIRSAPSPPPSSWSRSHASR
jgi:peptidoglycan/LPS O-acetylase OafA/YrhL